MFIFNRYCVFITLCLGCLTACGGGDSDTNINPPIPDVVQISIPASIKPYYDSFLSEMSDRGRDLSNKAFDVVLVDELSNGENFCAYGYINFQNSGVARVEIIDTERCWGQWNDIQKENLIYHEFGHALIGIDGHRNGNLPNGSFTSMMCSSDTCNNYRRYNIYQEDQRQYYLDELLNIQEASPAWSESKTFSEELYQDGFDTGSTDWLTEVLGADDQAIPYTFTFDDLDQSLIISSQLHTSTGVAFWYKDFDVSIVNNCSNIQLETDLVIEDLTDGLVAIIIDQYDDTDNRFDRQFELIEEASGDFPSFVTRAICVQPEAVKVRVSFYLDSGTESRAVMRNMSMNLYE